MNRRTERLIEKIYKDVFSKVFNKRSVDRLSKGDKSLLLKLVTILNSSEEFDKYAQKYAKELTKKGISYKKGEWRKYFNLAKKKGYIGIEKTWSKFEEEQMKKVIVNNFKLIKSIPQQTLEIMERKYTTTLIEEVAKGNLSRGSFYKELKSHGHKNAKMIARTESGKLQTSLIENRALDLGSVAYIWKSSKDKRTRPSHQLMNGVVVFWRQNASEKPFLDNMYGDPGGFPNCRCSPNPIFDEDDLTENTYRVYDYHTKTIIRMSKKDLLEAMKNKEL